MPELLSQPRPVPVQASASDVVDAFFEQVTGLAKAARDCSFGVHRLEGVPAGVAAVLQLLLHGGPQTVPRIGRARSTSRQNIQVLVNRMVAESWVELAKNPTHKRSPFVQLTESGKQLALSATEREVELHRLVSPHVIDDDLQKTTELLARLREVLSAKRDALVEEHPHKPSPAGKVRPTPPNKSIPAPESEPTPEDHELPVNLL